MSYEEIKEIVFILAMVAITLAFIITSRRQ
jgi:hypothetical protein